MMKLSPLPKACAVALALLCAPMAHALQVVDGVEGKTIFVKTSTRDLNRIAIEGGRVRMVRAADDAYLTGSADETTGQAMVMPLIDQPFGVFVFSESGKTYSLVLQPSDMPGESIVIREPRVEASPAAKPGRIENAPDHHMTVKRMIQTMAGVEPDLDGIEVKTGWDEIRLWQGTRFALEKTFTSYSLRGEQFRLFNLSPAQIRIAEQEFFKKGVLAVAVEDLALDPGRSTRVYVVKRSEGVR